MKDITPEKAIVEASRLFASLNIDCTIAPPLPDVREDWPNLLYNVTYSKMGQNLTVQFRKGIGHVKWPKRFEDIPQGCPPDLVPVFNTIRQNPGCTLKNKSEHARTAALLAQVQKVSCSPSEVFACICNDSYTAHSMSFRDYCENYGMDSDSIKARATYDQCCEQFHQISQFTDRASPIQILAAGMPNAGFEFHTLGIEFSRLWHSATPNKNMMITPTASALRRAANIKDKIERLNGEVDAILNGETKVRLVRRCMSPEARSKIAAAARRRWRAAKRAGP